MINGKWSKINAQLITEEELFWPEIRVHHVDYAGGKT